jgi:imidazolonepropionase-like amidohydrolase
MKAAGRTGSIAAGKAADLLVVDGDPLADIHDIERGDLTVRGGRMYPCTELWKLRSVTPVAAR